MASEIKHQVFQNKSLDYNKLLESQAEGKLLKKVLKYPLIAMLKYDGHYCVIIAAHGIKVFTTSGGIRYKHNIDLDLSDGTYIAERISSKGKLGASRRDVALEGPVGNKRAKASNTYIIHNKLNPAKSYQEILASLPEAIPRECLPEYRGVSCKQALDEYMAEITKRGYEGLMLIQPDYKFKNTKSRHIDFCKYKKRPTADLLCIDCTRGEGKYEGVIGALILTDSEGRLVNVGSGLTDSDRATVLGHFIGRVIEIEYEQIADTYIQPTYIGIRLDKTDKDID